MFLIVDNHDPQSVAHLEGILRARGLPHVTADRTAPFSAVETLDLQGVLLSGGSGIDVTDPLLFAQITLDIACVANLSVPILGICMGFEILVDACGGEVVSIGDPPPDCVDVTVLDQTGIFRDIPEHVCMMEFNSLGARSVPACLRVTACSQRSPIEAIEHRSRPIYATQFHPEATDAAGRQNPLGIKIVNNFLDLCLAPGAASGPVGRTA